MNCQIIWNDLPTEQWQKQYKRVRFSNILQSPIYAKAAYSVYGQKARYGLIMLDNQEAGVCQLMEVGLFKNYIHAIIMDRGPLWLNGFGNAEHNKSFYQEFNLQFPRRWGRRRRIMPELENTKENILLLSTHSLQRIKTIEPYETLWLDLTIASEQRRNNLKPSWRSRLKKFEQGKINLQWDWQGKFYPSFRQGYITDKAAKKYYGLSPALLDQLVAQAATKQSILIGRAMENGLEIAAILILCHGKAATYQVGWTTPFGREKYAHHGLLWQACSVLHSAGVENFDLGGVNDKSAKAVKTFKEGMGGRLVRYVGTYA